MAIDHPSFQREILGSNSHRVRADPIVTVTLTISFANFSSRFSNTTSFLTRRFSQGDLQGENDESDLPPDQRKQSKGNTSSQAGGRPTSATPNQNEQGNADAPKTLPIGSGKSSIVSAPTSPSKSGVSSFLSRATSITSSVKESTTFNVGGFSGLAGQLKDRIYDTSRQRILLVIDDNQTDWSRYFKGKRVHGDFEVKVEQAEFKDLTVTSNSESGTLCGIVSYDKGGNKNVRTFRPDCVLVRQHLQNLADDFRPIILGLQFGGVASVNSLHSLYNCTDRPWVFSQLIGIQNKLGKDAFPLIEQTYFPNYKEMLANPPKFPCVLKIGHAHSGQGKIKIESSREYEDVVSVVACSGTFCTSEPFIEAKCDIHIQKIASNYKAFMRKSISGNWKANVGSSVLEQIPVTDKYRRWLDAVAVVFGGLDIVTCEAVVDQSGREIIYEVAGSQMPLMGETQEEDRRLIADLVCMRMTSSQAMVKRVSRTSIPSSESKQGVSEKVDPKKKADGEEEKRKKSLRRASSSSTDSDEGEVLSNSTSATGIAQQMEQKAQQLKGLIRRASQATEEEPSAPKVEGQSEEDTMKNLKKTFAGIFGDM